MLKFNYLVQQFQTNKCLMENKILCLHYKKMHIKFGSSLPFHKFVKYLQSGNIKQQLKFHLWQAESTK